jgi:hypothetical protein
MSLSDPYEDARERRKQEAMDDDSYRAGVALDRARPPQAYCLKCGMPVEFTRVDGVQWQFDWKTTNLHRCVYVKPVRFP